jgi:diguanylate cyclase (GGDEF)-like protein/PAS domain S-box-containing protein
MASQEDYRIDSEEDTSSAYSSKASLADFEENYRTLVENAPDIFFIVDLKGKFILLNQAVRRITGRSTASLLESNLPDLVSPEYQDIVYKILNDAPQGIMNPYFEVEIVSLNGNRIPLEIHIKTVKDKKRRIAALRGVARDITERKKIEAAFKVSEKKFLELSMRSKDGVVIVQDFLCRFANKATSRILGYEVDEFKGKRFFEWFPSKDKGTLSQRHNQRLSGEEVPASLQTKILHKEGDIKEIEFFSVLIDHDGRPAEMGIIQDISESRNLEKALKLTEEKYQTLIDNLDEVVFATDPGGIFTYISPAVTRHFGYAPEEVIGNSFCDFVLKDDVPFFEASLKNILEGQKISQEIRMIDKTSNVLHMKITYSPIMEDNEPTGILGISTDITERKDNDEKLSQAYRDAESTNARFKAIIDNAPNIAIQGFNEKGEVIFWNSYSEKLLGLTEEQAKGKHLKGILASHDQEEKFNALIQEVLRTHKPSSLLEWSVKRNAGEEKHILASVFPIVQQGKNPIAIAMDMDISEQKRAEKKILEASCQIEKFSKISAAILSIEDQQELFEYIAQAVVDISDFSRVLISYFTDKFPFRDIIAFRGVRKDDLERAKKVEMPKEKFLSYFEQGKRIGNQSCYIPHLQKNILDQQALISSEKDYPESEGTWHKDDNLFVCMKDTKGEVIGMISVDDSKSGKIPTEETVRPLEIFANLISEIVQKRRLSKKIEESEAKYRELVTNIRVGIMRAAPEGEILEANPSVIEMFGFKESDKFLSRKTTNLYQNPNDGGFFIKEIEENGLVQNKDILMKKKDGKTFWASVTATAVRNDLGKINHYDAVIEDITERKKLQEEVKRLLVIDELTGLYNRRYFNEKLPMVIKATETFRSSLAIVMVDVDDFKIYNDTYHHLEGDEVLKEISRIIYQNIRNFKDENWISKFGREEFAFNDWAARFGGDEFVVVLPGQSAEDAVVVAERIRDSFEKASFMPKGKTVKKTVSLGIASCFHLDNKPKKGTKKRIFPFDYEKASTELTNLADKALFDAKKGGKNKTVVSKSTIELSRTSEEREKSGK